MRWRHNPWVVAVVLVIGAVAIGMVSFLLTGLIGPDRDVKPARLAPNTLMKLDGAPVALLRLPWGSGKGASVNETVQYVFLSGRYCFVVDIDPDTMKSRIRWFDAAGRVAGSYACPDGATNFSPFRDGFSFVIAPGATEGEELAALYSVEQSQLTTYTVPLTFSSAGLLEHDGVLYSQIDDSLFDVRAQRVTIEGKLVPVAIRGRQLSDTEAGEGVVDARYLGQNGRLYNRMTEAVAGDTDSQTRRIRDVESSSTVEVPPFGEFLGVDVEGLAYVQVKSETPPSTPEIAGITRKSDAVTLVLVADFDEGGQWVLPVQTPHPFPYLARPFSVTREGLVALRATDKGIEVLQYRRKAER